MSRRIDFEAGKSYTGWRLRDDGHPVLTVASRSARALVDADGRTHKIVIGLGPLGEDCETIRVDEDRCIARGGVFRACAAVGGAA